MKDGQTNCMKLRWFFVLSTFLIPLSSWGVTTLNQIKSHGEEEFSLLFNGNVGRDQIEIEYVNDIVQLSLKGVSIYPAKILPIEKGLVTKIFAYQYSPKVVRCRFSVKGKAEDFKNKLKISPEGKVLGVHFSPKEPVIAPISEDDVDEKALYEKVLKANEVKQEQLDPTLHSTTQKIESDVEKPIPAKASSSPKLSTSALGAFAKLGGVILLFLLMAFGIKKLKSIHPEKKSGFLGAITQFAKGTLGKDPKMIEVVSTHYLDPKKSIAVIKVAGRLLVLGVSNESINLITQITEESSFDEIDDIQNDRVLPQSVQPSVRRPSGNAQIFSDILYSEKEKPALGHLDSKAVIPNARSRIRSRLEGLKPL